MPSVPEVSATGLYGPGDWFLLPVPDGRWTPGRVVLRVLGHVTLSYVFSPSWTRPTLADVRGLRAGEALLGVMVSGLALADGSWPLLGGADDFVPLDWPVPEFESVVPDLPGRSTLLVERYDRDLRRLSAQRVPEDEAGQRPPGGSMGSGYLQQWLPRVLAEGALRPMQERSWWPAAVAAGHAPGRLAPRPAVEPFGQLVLVVVPGSSGADVAGDLEDLLLDELDADGCEVDGSLLGPDGAELRVYARDAEALAPQVAAVLAGRRLPVGSHLVVRSGAPGDGGRRVALP